MKAEVYYKGTLIDTLSAGKTMTLHCEGDLLTDDIVIKAIADDTGTNQTPTIISFTIDGKTYRAEEGMTWAEFVVSEYNVDDFYIKILTVNNYVSCGYTSDAWKRLLYANGSSVDSYDYIIANEIYKTELVDETTHTGGAN